MINKCAKCGSENVMEGKLSTGMGGLYIDCDGVQGLRSGV